MLGSNYTHGVPYEQITYEVSNQVATLTLNRPDKLNAWTQKMEEEYRGDSRGGRRRPGARHHSDRGGKRVFARARI